MAYVFNPNLSEEENQRRAAAEEAARPATAEISGGGVPPAGGAPGAPTSSGSFTNLQRYLQENSGGAASLGEKVAGQVTAAGEAAKGALEGVARTAQEQIESGRVQRTSVIDDAAQDPTSVVSDPDRKAAFERQRDAAYTGPQGLEDVEGFQDAQAKLQELKDKAGMTQTESGRMELLRTLSPAGSGKGKLTLNQLLLAGSPEASDMVAAAPKPFENLESYLSAQSEEARARARSAAEETTATREEVRNRFLGEEGALPAFEQGISQRVGETIQQAKERLARQQKAIELGLILPEDMEGLGAGTAEDISRGVRFGNFLNSFYGAGFNPADYFTQTGAPEVGISAANVATPQEYAQYVALAELLGVDPTFLSPDNAGLAGTASMDFADIDFQGLRSLPETLRARDQEMFDRFGVTVEPDGRLSIAGDITTEGNPQALLDRLTAIGQRGIGNLPGDGDQFPGWTEETDEIIRRILEGGMAINPMPISPRVAS